MALDVSSRSSLARYSSNRRKTLEFGGECSAVPVRCGRLGGEASHYARTRNEKRVARQ